MWTSLRSLRMYSRTSFKFIRGFSLVEVMITIAIIMVVTTIVVIKYGSFNSTMLLKSQAYEMALNLREAQVFAISVRTGSASATAFRDAYGLHFDTDTPNQYLLFLDTNEDSRYNNGEAINEPFLIDSRFVITGIATGANCTDAVDALSVTFKRPDFDANIASGSGTGLNAACITIAPVKDTAVTRVVYVGATGQIEVQ